jgi:hypothetical protein
MDERMQYFGAWAQQKARYSRAKRGRNERGASLVECALLEAAARALGHRAAQTAPARAA